MGWIEVLRPRGVKVLCRPGFERELGEDALHHSDLVGRQTPLPPVR